MQLAETMAGVDAELVGEDLAHAVVRRERLRLLATAVVGEHEQLPQPLAQGMLADAPLQLGHDGALAAERQVGLHPGHHDRLPQLVEPPGLGLAEGGVLTAGVRRTSPQVEGVTARLDGRLRPAPGQRLAGEIR